MKSKKVLVTVGTTNFNKLIETVCRKETLNKLYDFGYSHITLQTGSIHFEKMSHDSVNLQFTPYIDDFISKIREVDLVISHAGAGTCMEVLKEGKPLIVVVNEDLMDNHQFELAEQLQKDGYVYFSTCKTLLSTLNNDLTILKKYPKINSKIFSTYLDSSMGFL